MSAIATSLPWIGRRRAAVLAALAAAAGVLVCMPSPAAAQRLPTLLVLPGSGRAVSVSIIERARFLLVQSLSRPDRMRVIDFDRPPTPMPAPPGVAIAIAQQMGANMAVSFDLARDGARTVFEVWCWDVSSGGAACHLREATSAGPETLPDLAEWLAVRMVGALGGTAPTGVPGVSVAPGPPRPPRAFSIGGRAGLFVPVASPANDTLVLGGFALLLSYDGGHVITDLGLETSFAGGDDCRTLGVGVDLFFPLGSGESVPYLGPGIFWVDQHFGGRGASGVQLRPTVGMLWGRHATVRLRVEAAYFVDLFEEQEMDRLIPGSDEGHLAHGLMLSTGATF